ncbi:hypothetical protein BSN85_22555 [Bradyrhizobium brasilense]|nr:hypothetical protein BSN85_22555 [Bradyrhizobium brasilense]
MFILMGDVMTKTTTALLLSSAAALALAANMQRSLATEPGNFGNFLAGSTMGATVATAPPPGLYFTNTFTYIPMASGNGNSSCGDGCKSRYNAAIDSVNLTWGTGLQFLGGDYFPTIQQTGYQASATSLPYPAGGGPGLSPVYSNILDFEIGNTYINPLNFSWKFDGAYYFAAGLGFVVPSGTTFAGSLVPDYWTIRPHWAFSYLGDGWNLTASFVYDINTASRGNTGLYQIIARNPATLPATSLFLTGTANPGRGYTTGNYLYLDWTATKKFGKWEVGPVGFFKYQTTDDVPGGINPATSAAWTCQELRNAKLPTCGKDVNIGVGLLVGYNFGPVDMKLIYANGFYSRDAINAPTGSTIFLKTSFRIWAPDEPTNKPRFAKD